MKTLGIIPWFIINAILHLGHSVYTDIASVTLSNEEIISTDQFLMSPQWSPDDSQLLASGEANNGIFIYSLATNELNQISNLKGSGYRPSWSPEGDFILFRYKDQMEIFSQYETHSAFLNGKKRKLEQAIDPFTLFTLIGDKKNNDVGIIYNRQTLQVEGRFNDGNESWLITPGTGVFYHPVLSPNRKFVLVHSKSKMFVYASDGSGLIAELGQGLGTTWSPNSKQIIFTIDESEDGHYTTGAELYYTDLSGNRIQLTETPDRIEGWPNWSHDGKHLAFSDAMTGELIISDIELK